MKKKEIIEEIYETIAFISSCNDWEERTLLEKQRITEPISDAIDKALTAQLDRLEEGIKELGHQQEDNTIWCDMDKTLALIAKEKLSAKE